MHLKSVKKVKKAEELFVKYIKEEANNKFIEPKVARETIRRHLVEMGVITVKRADIKNTSRQKAFMNIRNPLSLVAMMRVIHRRIDPALVFSSDDVSVLLNGWTERPSVLTTKEAIKLLKKIGIGVSVTENMGKQRVVTFNCTISYQCCVCKVMKFSDYNFTDFKEQPKVLNMGEAFYIILHHPNTDGALIQKMMYWCCIIPSVIAHQSSIIQSAGLTLDECEVRYSQSSAESQASDFGASAATTVPNFSSLSDSGSESDSESDSVSGTEDGSQTGSDVLSDAGSDSGSQGSSQAGADALPDAGSDADSQAEAGSEADSEAGSAAQSVRDTSSSRRGRSGRAAAAPVALTPTQRVAQRKAVAAKFKYVCIMCDGAIPQIKALLKSTRKRCAKAKYRVVMGKYPGGTSLSTSPNDQGKMHQGTHANIHAALRGYVDYPEPKEQAWVELKALLQKLMDRDSFKTLWKCCRAAPTVLKDCFKTSSVQKAFSLAGTEFVHKNGEVGPNDIVMLSHCPNYTKLSNDKATFVLLTDIMARDGFITEHEFEKVLAGDVEIDACGTKTGKPLELMATSRQRACLLNSPGWLEHLKLVGEYEQEQEYEKTLREEKKKEKATDQGTEATQGVIASTGNSSSSSSGKSKYKTCCNQMCGRSLTSWMACRGKYCRVVCCVEQEQCIHHLREHENACSKPKKGVNQV